MVVARQAGAYSSIALARLTATAAAFSRYTAAQARSSLFALAAVGGDDNMKLALSIWLVLLALTTLRVGATGTVTIVHTNGQRDIYNDVAIKIIHGTLYMTSQDGKGTMVIGDAACSYQGKVMVCFATKATLVQTGEVSPLDFKNGTVYLNNTDDYQPLVMSTAKLPPHSIMLSYTTKLGTYISCTGSIDKVVK
jgi:hypothetical protein